MFYRALNLNPHIKQMDFSCRDYLDLNNFVLTCWLDFPARKGGDLSRREIKKPRVAQLSDSNCGAR